MKKTQVRIILRSPDAIVWRLSVAAAILLAAASLSAQQTYTPYTFSTLAGTAGLRGAADGTGSAARFGQTLGVALDAVGSVYVADGNTTIRKITTGGVVTTLVDETGSTARFSSPNGVAVDGSGNIYVADGNSTIRKIATGGVVTTLAGTAGSVGSADGTGSAARFIQPNGVAVDGAGNVYVADSPNNTIRKITPVGVVTTLAGVAGTRGIADGTGSAARFSSPYGVAVDGAGNVYVADSGNSTIRKITPDGVVTTLAGTAGSTGSTDGTGPTARFWNPVGLAVDGVGNVYVGDAANDTIRKITPGGVVTTLAGTVGYTGSADGRGSAAQFNGPTGVAVDAAGNVYIADASNFTIRWGALAAPALTSAATANGSYGQSFSYKVTFSGALAGFSATGLPTGLSLNSTTGVISGQPTSAVGTYPVILNASNGAGSGSATLSLVVAATVPGAPTSVSAIPGNGQASVSFTAPASRGGLTLSYTVTATPSTGSPVTATGPASPIVVTGLTNGTAYSVIVVATNSLGASVASSAPPSVTPGVAPTITTQPISQSVAAGASVSFNVVVTGTPTPTYQWQFNGTAISGATSSTYNITSVNAVNAGAYTAAVTNIVGTAMSNAATLTVTSPPLITAQPVFQLINAGASVSFTVVASSTPTPSYQWQFNCNNISGATSATYSVTNVGLGNQGNYTVVISNALGQVTSNAVTLKLNPAYMFTTLAGSAGVNGSADGTALAARFNAPSGVAADGAGNLYVADTGNGTIRKITSAGAVLTLAGTAGTSGIADGTGGAARFAQPKSVAVDGSGNVYVADSGNSTIRKITPGGVVTTLAGTPGQSGYADGSGATAQFANPQGVAVDGAGNVYVADSNSHTIRKITGSGVVTTLAGNGGIGGSADGTGNAARFYYPCGVAVDGTGNVYVGDTNNYTVRKITPAGVVTTLAGAAGVNGSVDGTGSAAWFNAAQALAVDGVGNVYEADSNNYTIRKITSGGVVTTLAGAVSTIGSVDGTGSAAQFNYPSGVAVDGFGNVYVADKFNSTVRKGTSVSPVIATPPQNLTVAPGNTAAFSVRASGATALSYQWQFNGVNIAGATGSTLAVANAQAANAGGYTVLVTNSVGSVMSGNATLTVATGGTDNTDKPVITSDPRLQSSAMGQSATLNVVAAGSALTYQWYQGTSGQTAKSIDGATSASFVTPFVTQSTDYWVRISNGGGRVDSATLTVPGPTTTPPPQTTTMGLVNMSVRVTTTGNPIIPGLVIDTATTVLVRVAGPSLTQFGVQGVLPNPKVSVYFAGRVVAENDDWGTNEAAVMVAAAKVGAFPFVKGSKDAALVVDLTPGAYTCVITGEPGTTGEILLEVYRVP